MRGLPSACRTSAREFLENGKWQGHVMQGRRIKDRFSSGFPMLIRWDEARQGIAAVIGLDMQRKPHYIQGHRRVSRTRASRG